MPLSLFCSPTEEKTESQGSAILKEESKIIRRSLRPTQGLLFTIVAIAISLWHQPTQAYTIEGKIEHQEALPSVDSSIRKGARFSAGAEAEANNNWVKVPPWLAGTWTVREETAVLRHDFKTGRIDRNPSIFMAKQEFTYGSQKDRQGGIWHYIGAPYTSKTKLTAYQELHQVKEKQFLVANDAQVQFRTLMTVVRVSNMSGRVADSFQQESITSYRPVEDGIISLAASNKTFDANGRALFQQDNEARIRRYKHFYETDKKDGKNLRELFLQYLEANGLSNLIP
ncbi:hypothetical protein BH11CYA1_BH11CYA1_32490 [soil metagenome]